MCDYFYPSFLSKRRSLLTLYRCESKLPALS